MFKATNWGILWVLVRDFNCTLLPSNQKGGNELFTNDIGVFSAFLLANRMMDVDLNNGKLTWSNKRVGDKLIQLRIDRFFLYQEAI